MSRFAVVLLALVVGSAAHAKVPVRSAEAMLEQTVRLQLDSYRGMLGAMSRDGAGAKGSPEYDAHLAAADQHLDEAQSLHAAGDNEDAIVHLTRAWREISPAAKVWTERATANQKRGVVRAMVGNTGERLEVMQTYRKDLPTGAAEALDRAQASHREALQLRTSDPKASMAAEKSAIQALNRSFGLMWQDYEGDDGAGTAARRR
jgi:hypothetical protein